MCPLRGLQALHVVARRYGRDRQHLCAHLLVRAIKKNVQFFVIAAFCIELRSLDSIYLAVVLGCPHYAGFKHSVWRRDDVTGIDSTYVLACCSRAKINRRRDIDGARPTLARYAAQV